MDLVDPLSEPCAVCGDKSTGTHYGTVSCNGCKGFFRRTILRNQRFTCRFNKQCVIDKNFRCACRYCRFQKCLNAGMKREAIQFERDSIGSPAKRRRDSSPQSNAGQMPPGSNEGGAGVNCASQPTACTDVIDTLMELEARVNQEMSMRYRNSMLASSSNAHQQLFGDGQPGGLAGASSADSPTSSAFSQPVRSCTVDDLNEISRTTLLLMVEWAKNLAPFPDLSMEDKIILLKNYAPQHLILMPAFRSPDTTRVCLFNNGFNMSRDQQQNASGSGSGCNGSGGSGAADLSNGFAAFKTSNITPRVLDEIVWPMRQLEMREQEFVCLKALAFLHPEAKGLSATSQTLIREARNRVLKALYSIILAQSPEEAPTRYGNILLLAPALKALTQLLIENMTLTKFFGLAEVDSLLSEFILDDLNDQSSAPASIKEHLATPSYSTPTSVAGQQHSSQQQAPNNQNSLAQTVSQLMNSSSGPHSIFARMAPHISIKQEESPTSNAASSAAAAASMAAMLGNIASMGLPPPQNAAGSRTTDASSLLTML
uniref:Uncharacterized protein n=1 Tax=Ditylenchus dipsaci TaxID=166011 RepID=A0A915DA38_9BILA